MDKKVPLTNEELGSIAEQIDAITAKLKGAAISPLLGFAHSGLHGAAEAIQGEIKNRAAAPAEKPAA